MFRPSDIARWFFRRAVTRPHAQRVRLGADIVMEDRVVPNTAPYAPDELWWTHAAQSVSIWPGVSDDDGDGLTLAVASQPAHGTVTTDGYNEFLYTPNPDFVGSDSFTYTASDGFPGGNSTGTVTISVDNTAPSAPDESATTAAGEALSIWPGVSDDDGDGLTLAVASQPGHGTVTTDGYNEFLYTPNPDFVGTDSFTYTASDGFPGGTSTGTITVTVEPPFVTIESWQGSIEGSPTPGSFRFTRTGPTVSDLTVDYTIDDPTEFDVATPGKDYQVLSGSVVIPAGAQSVDVPVAPMKDNEFEDDEPVQITLVAPPPETARYQIDEATATQIVTITDDPPQATATAVWEQVGDEIGQVALTRSGGNINEALTVWFDTTVTGTVDGDDLSIVLGGTASFPAGQANITVIVNQDPATGSTNTVNASAPEARADKTADIEGFFVGQVSAGDKFAEFLKTIDSPVTMEEYKVLKRIANGDPELLDPELIYPAEQRTIAALAAQDKIDAGVDWRTVTPAPIGIAGGPVFAAILTGKGWQKTSENLTSFITDLGNDNFDTRQRADDAIRALLDTAIQKGDYTRLWLILDRVEDQQVNNDSAEVKFRLGRILRDYGSVLDEGSLKLFKKAKQGAANGAAGAP